MNMPHWLYSKLRFADLMIAKATDVLFVVVVVVVIFLLFFLLIII